MKNTLKLILAGTSLLAFTATAHSAEVLGVDIHGFISQGYLQSSDNNFVAGTEDGTFEFNEFGLNIGKQLNDKLRVGIQFFARDLGDYGNDDVTIDWSYGDYRWKDWLGLRIGKLKAPHGLYNETRDVDMLRTSIFLPQSVYGEVTRDTTLNLLGGGIYGTIDMSKAGSLSYQGQVGSQNIDSNEALAQKLMGVTFGGTEVSNQSIDVEIKYVAGLVWETPLEGLRVGGTFSKTDMNLVSDYDFGSGDQGILDFDLKSESYVLSAEYTWNNLLVAGEYTWSNHDGSVNNGSNMVNKPDGWYLSASYRFIDWFELGGYYSESYSDRNDRDGENFDPDHRAYTKDMCLTARFDINENWAIKLEGHMFNGTSILSGIDNLVTTDGSDQFEKDWQLYATKLTFSF